MSRDLIALIFAMGLAVVVVLVGLRRDLSETTRANLPRFSDGDQVSDLAVELPERNGQAGASVKQARWLATMFLILGLIKAVDAVLSSDDRLISAVLAAMILLTAGIWLRRSL